MPPPQPSRAEFRQNLVSAFSMGELETLCSDLGVDPELIGGKDQGKEHWADQIILYFEQSGRIEQFVARLNALRPNVGWAYAPAMVDLDGDGWLDLYATTGFLSFKRGKPDG